MNKNLLLNYQLQPATETSNAQTMVFLHGLFGDMNNLCIIARSFDEQYI